MFEGCILVFKNVLNAKLLPLQARLGAWAVSEGTRKGLLRSGHWGDPPPIRWQDVNPNPVHTKTCGVGGGGGRRGSHETSTTALTLPRVLVCAAPQVGPAGQPGGRPGEGGAGAPAALRASVANPAARPPARPPLQPLPRWPNLRRRRRPEAPRQPHAAPLQRRAPPPTPRLAAAFVPGRLQGSRRAPARGAQAPCKRHLVLRLPAPENPVPGRPATESGTGAAAGDGVAR